MPAFFPVIDELGRTVASEVGYGGEVIGILKILGRCAVGAKVRQIYRPAQSNRMNLFKLLLSAQSRDEALQHLIYVRNLGLQHAPR